MDAATRRTARGDAEDDGERGGGPLPHIEQEQEDEEKQEQEETGKVW